VPSPADPVALTLGGLSVRWYALFILSGIVLAVLIVRALAKRRGLDADFPLDIAPWIVVSGILGARGYYVLLRWRHFADHPDQAFNIRLGGLSIHGALVVGVVVLFLLCRRVKEPFLVWADLLIVGVAVGQGVGRWGNWANQEAFGTPTNLLWGVEISPERRPPDYLDATHFHPTFLYESLFDLANAVILAWIVLRMRRATIFRPGDALWIYFVLYGVARFLIERVRTDSLYIGPLPAAYWFSGALIVVGAGMLLTRHLGRDTGQSRPA